MVLTRRHRKGRNMVNSHEVVTLKPTSPSHAAPVDSPQATAQGTDQVQQPATGENLYLIGRPRLKDFLRYVRHHAVNVPREGDLVDQWHVANEVVRQLEKEEAGLADDPPIRKMGPEYTPLLIEFLKDPLIRHGFNTVPTEVAFVELDRLIVYQKHIDLTYARQIEEKLGPTPSDELIFRTCLPYDHPQPPVKWSRVRRDQYIFVSPSNDLRFLGTMSLESKHLVDHVPPGNVVGIVGIAIGFGSNFLNAIYANRRLILNNGSHRAYALRKMGLTHVPCIIQHVSSRHDLEVVAASDIMEDPDMYLEHPRPSMLKDYFNPKLQLVMPVHRRLHHVTVKFEVDENYSPAL